MSTYPQPGGQPQVVTCRSVVDGYDWVEEVLFHADGSFTLLRL